MAGHHKWAKGFKGAEDFNTNKIGFEILTEPASFEAVHKKWRMRRYNSR